MKRIVIHSCFLEIGLAFAAGYFLAKYMDLKEETSPKKDKKMDLKMEDGRVSVGWNLFKR